MKNKSCPFCRHDNTEIKFWLEPMGQYFFVKCNYCLSFGPRYLQMFKNDAISDAWKGWNNREHEDCKCKDKE